MQFLTRTNKNQNGRGRKLTSAILFSLLSFGFIGCGSDSSSISSNNSAETSSVYPPTTPLSPSKSESVVSSLIVSKIPSGPLLAQLLEEPQWIWSVTPYLAYISQYSSGTVYSATAYNNGVAQVRPPFPLPTNRFAPNQ
jgi:hypothetical protein